MQMEVGRSTGIAIAERAVLLLEGDLKELVADARGYAAPGAGRALRGEDPLRVGERGHEDAALAEAAGGVAEHPLRGGLGLEGVVASHLRRGHVEPRLVGGIGPRSALRLIDVLGANRRREQYRPALPVARRAPTHLATPFAGHRKLDPL